MDQYFKVLNLKENLKKKDICKENRILGSVEEQVLYVMQLGLFN